MILSKKTQQEAEHEVMYLVLKDLSFKEESGDDGVVDTPVPIPNTEVKHHSGDDSASKSSTLPVLFFYSFAPYLGLFLFINIEINLYTNSCIQIYLVL